MQSSFWINKWENQEIGFHLEKPHPLLEKYYELIFQDHKSILLPLCGKSKDLTYLAKRKFDVVGCELSPLAVGDFFSENSLQPLFCKLQQFNIYTYGNIKVMQGDFFEMESSIVSPCTAIYDRAALIALPPLMRRQYVTHLKNLLPEAEMLLITLSYDQSCMDGPPFSVDEEEVGEIFDFAEVVRLYHKNIIEKELKFKQNGLSYLYETAYHIKW